CACTISHSITVPGKALASDNCCIAVYSVVDRQVKCNCILTSLCIIENKVLRGACTIGHSFTVPGKALAGDNCCIGVYSVVDRQVKCDGILTSLCILDDILLCCACTISHSVTVPGKALAGDNCCIGVYSVVDRQMKCDCILTSLCIVKNIMLCRICSIYYSIAVPGKGLTGDNCSIGVYSVIDRQMKCDSILTSLCII